MTASADDYTDDPPTPCHRCGGTGKASPYAAPETCRTCAGTGVL